MPVFRFKGLNAQGKLVQNEFEADNKKTAQLRIDKFAKTRNVRLQALEPVVVRVVRTAINGFLV